MLKKKQCRLKATHADKAASVCECERESTVLKVYECVSAVNDLVSKTAEELLIKFSLSEARKESQEKC